MEQKS
jgi:hypothetical protein